MPHPGASAYGQTSPDTKLDRADNAIAGGVVNANTIPQTAFGNDGSPHPQAESLSLDDMVHIAFDDRGGSSVRATVRKDKKDTSQYLTLQGHTEAAWTDREGWYTPNGSTWGDLGALDGVAEVLTPAAGQIMFVGCQMIWDAVVADAIKEYTLLGYDDTNSDVTGGFSATMVPNTGPTMSWRSRIRYENAGAHSSRTTASLQVEWQGQHTFPWLIFNWDNEYHNMLGREPALSRGVGFGGNITTGDDSILLAYTNLSLFATPPSNNKKFNDVTQGGGSSGPKVSVRNLYIGVGPKNEVSRALDTLIREMWR